MVKGGGGRANPVITLEKFQLFQKKNFFAKITFLDVLAYGERDFSEKKIVKKISYRKSSMVKG